MKLWKISLDNIVGVYTASFGLTTRMKSKESRNILLMINDSSDKPKRMQTE